MRRLIATPVAVCLLLWSSADARRSPLPKGFSLLAGIQSPYQLVTPHLPPRYFVPVTLGGSVAVEMAGTLKDLAVADPRYVEVYGQSGQFRLMLQNPELPESTRDLLSGILNPLEMIETVLNSFLHYRKEQTLREMARDANMVLSPLPERGTTFIAARLTPKGKRFAYRFRDAGAYTKEDWLTQLTVVVDTSTMLVHEVELVRGERTVEATNLTPPKERFGRQRYVFAYGAVDTVAVPQRLELYIDNEPTMTISAAYRRVGEYILFDSRSIAYRMPGSSAELSLSYGPYDLEVKKSAVRRALDPGDRIRDLKRAAALAQEAVRAFDQGDIEEAGRVLGRLSKQYPGTPQGVEAKRILGGLQGTP